MQRWIRALRRLRAEKNSGMAMITLLCASAIFLALASALVYSASTMLATAGAQLMQERCYQLAKSFSAAIAQDLCVEKPPPEDSKSVYNYANGFLDGRYNLYDPDNINNTSYSYSTTATESDRAEYGKITVRLYKEESEGDNSGVGGEGGVKEYTEVFEFGDEGEMTPETAERLNTFESSEVNDYRFAVQVTAALDAESFRYATRYYRMVQYDPVYTLGGERVFRIVEGVNSGKWSRTSGSGVQTPISPDSLKGATIVGKYDTEKVISRKFTQEGA